MSSRWPVLIALALTGSELDADGEAGCTDAADADAIATALIASGWDAERIRAHALDELAAGRSWPHVVDPSLRQGVSPAQFWAVVKDARRALGLEVLGQTFLSRRTELDADERRLLADRPPHHVAR